MGLKNGMLNLNDSLLLFKGNVRCVYQHPEDPEKCIKIIFNPRKKRSARREINYLKLYHLLGKPFDRLPKYYGRLKTNQGRGEVFDLVRDYHGGISRSLSHYILKKPEGGPDSAEITAELQALCNYFIQHNIIVYDPAPHNIVIQRLTDSSMKFVIVDGIGNPHFIKFGDCLSAIGRTHILKKWKRYMEDNPLMQDVLVRGGYTPFS